MAGIVKNGREKTIFLLHRTWSAFGTKRTCRRVQRMSAFGGKADIGWRVRSLYLCAVGLTWPRRRKGLSSPA
jgi:hypothetical protein